MNTEITDNEKSSRLIFYDAGCRLCVGLAQRFGRVLAARNFKLLPLQSPGARGRLGLSEAELLDEMRLLLPDGRSFGGTDALVEISRSYWWAWPLGALGNFAAGRKALRAAYRWLAHRRSCANGACEVRARMALTDFLPLILLPLIALSLANGLPNWVFMWAMAFALYAGCKWLTYRSAVTRGAAPSSRRALAYLAAWPGMDTVTFLHEKARPAKPGADEWLIAAAKTCFGGTLVWLIARFAMPVQPLLAGWVAMVGVVCFLHFGSFHLLALAWRSAGVNAAPLMRNPARAVSLAEFWSRRWNTAFHELVHRFTFRPMARQVGVTRATLRVFLLSGLVHELVISLPAQGGYGLPTAYFVIQGLGVLGEHTRAGRRLGLGGGARGWCFTMLVVAAPAFWLFHPPFIRNVILPMLHALGAT